MPRLEMKGDGDGYVLIWGGVHIRVSEEEWDDLTAQAMEIDEARNDPNKGRRDQEARDERG